MEEKNDCKTHFQHEGRVNKRRVDAVTAVPVAKARRASARLLPVFVMLLSLLIAMPVLKTALAAECAAFVPGAPVAEIPQVWIQAPELPLVAGDTFELQFIIGTASVPVQGLFGIAFELRYSDATFLHFDSTQTIQAGDFLQPDVYTFVRHEPENKIIYVAVSRKRGAPGQSGTGVVLSLPLQIDKNVPAGWETCFAIQAVVADDSSGGKIEIEAGPSVCVKIKEPEIHVIPNPFTPNDDGYNDEVEFNKDDGFPREWVVTIMDRSGRVVRRLTNGENTWDGRDENGNLMLPGPYLYAIRDGERFVRRGIVALIR